MKKLPISEASVEQLRTFAREVQQIDQIPQARDGVIAALVESGHTADFIYIDGDERPEAASDSSDDLSPALLQLDEVSEVPAEMPTTGFAYWKDSPMVTLRIMPTERPGGNEPAHPQINSSPPLVIPRNKLVRIPYDFYLVLRQAGGSTYRAGATPNDELVKVDYQEYPMNDVVMPTKAAVDAWRAKTEGDELGRPKARAA